MNVAGERGEAALAVVGSHDTELFLMNQIYRVIWNTALGSWTVVSELATSRGKRSSLKKVGAALLVGAVIQGQALAAIYTQPVIVSDGNHLALNNGDLVTVTVDDAAGLWSENTGSAITGTNVTVNVNGTNSNAAYAADGGQITLSNGSLTTGGGSGSDAIWAVGAGSRIDASLATSIQTTGDSSYGASATDGGVVTLEGSSNISTTGSNSVGLYSSGQQASLAAYNAALTHCRSAPCCGRRRRAISYGRSYRNAG